MAATVKVAGLLKPENPSCTVTRPKRSSTPRPSMATMSKGYFSETNKATIPIRIPSTMSPSAVIQTG